MIDGSVLVTGGGGQLASDLGEQLGRLGATVRAMNCEVLNEKLSFYSAGHTCGAADYPRA